MQDRLKQRLPGSTWRTGSGCWPEEAADRPDAGQGRGTGKAARMFGLTAGRFAVAAELADSWAAFRERLRRR